jgi:hypothetical protein
MIQITDRFGKAYYNALVAKYEAQIMEAEANLDLYFHKMVAIGEHSDMQAEFERWLAVIADVEGKLHILKSRFEINENV